MEEDSDFGWNLDDTPEGALKDLEWIESEIAPTIDTIRFLGDNSTERAEEVLECLETWTHMLFRLKLASDHTERLAALRQRFAEAMISLVGYHAGELCCQLNPDLEMSLTKEESAIVFNPDDPYASPRWRRIKNQREKMFKVIAVLNRDYAALDFHFQCLPSVESEFRKVIHDIFTQNGGQGALAECGCHRPQRDAADTDANTPEYDPRILASKDELRKSVEIVLNLCAQCLEQDCKDSREGSRHHVV